MKITVFIIDDHKILVDSFSDHFARIDDIEVIGYALSGCEAIEELHPDKCTPDIILQDIELKDMFGIDCTKALLKNNPKLKIIGVSSYTESAIVKRLMKAGGKGYISKSTDISNLEEAIREVNAGENYFGEYIVKSLKEHDDKTKKPPSIIPSFSKRELDVLELIAEGLNTNEIADKLFISANTVNSHRKNLILNFDVSNSVGLVRKALDMGILQPS